MAFAVTNDFTGSSTITAADLDENFADIENKLNNGVDDSNFSGTANISNSRLANSQLPLVVTMGINETIYSTSGIDGTIVSVAGIPATTTDTYTVVAAQWAITDIGAEDMQFGIEWGSYTDADRDWETIVPSIPLVE